MSFAFDFMPDVEEASEKPAFANEILPDMIHPCKLIPRPDQLLLTKISHRDVTTAQTILKQSQLHYQCGIDKDLDVVNGHYEGGYKVWECSIDLVDYIISEIKDVDTAVGSLFCNGRVLELGCGHAFPGIIALQMGCSSLVLSDFNEEVLVESTWPNIVLNCPDKTNKVECFAGDWIALSEHLLSSGSGVFDVVLAAETLYTIESCRKMFYMIDKHLSSTGIALVASKRFYFGVGGGTMELSNLVENSTSNLSFEVVKEYMDGSSNIREIVMLRRNRVR